MFDFLLVNVENAATQSPKLPAPMKAEFHTTLKDLHVPIKS